jgi:hypothetical protein
MQKIQRSFYGGETNQSRRPHLVDWDVCCLPKNEGGLGIKKPHHMNDAFLLTMLSNLINNPDDLWCKVLYGKYGRNNDLRVTIQSQPNDSPLWKTLTGIWDQFQQDIVWQLRDGSAQYQFLVGQVDSEWNFSYFHNTLCEGSGNPFRRVEL